MDTISKKKVLVTGDDGYKAVGLRLVANVLKPDYDVVLIATKEQRSGMGGSISSFGEKAWGKEVVDGIDSYWVEGNPADAMEFAQGMFPGGFDYVISGINNGENIGLATVTASGTGGAALRALSLGLSNKIVIMSWMLDSTANYYWMKDSSNENIEDYINYPGGSIKFIFSEIIKNDFFDKRIVNVNFPYSETKEYKITKFIDSITKFYKYPVIIKNGSYKYDEQVFNYSEKTKNDFSTDVGALLSGYISITPFNIE